MSTEYAKNPAVAEAEEWTVLPSKASAHAWRQNIRKRLRVWHADDLPVLHCESHKMSPQERMECITCSLAKTMRTLESERYLLPSLPVLANFWMATPEETHFALKHLADYGYSVVIPGYNGDVSVSRIA